MSFNPLALVVVAVKPKRERDKREGPPASTSG